MYISHALEFPNFPQGSPKLGNNAKHKSFILLPTGRPKKSNREEALRFLLATGEFTIEDKEETTTTGNIDHHEKADGRNMNVQDVTDGKNVYYGKSKIKKQSNYDRTTMSILRNEGENMNATNKFEGMINYSKKHDKVGEFMKRRKDFEDKDYSNKINIRQKIIKVEKGTQQRVKSKWKKFKQRKL